MGFETPKTPKKYPKKSDKFWDEKAKETLAKLESRLAAQKPPTPLTEEEREKTESRDQSDRQLEKDFVVIKNDGSWKMIGNQVERAKKEMEGEMNSKEAGHYYGNEKINGINFIVRWDERYNQYTVYFPDIKIYQSMVDLYGVEDQIIRISNDPKKAEEVFDYIKKEAKNVRYADPYSLYKEVDEFIQNLDLDNEENEDGM